MVSPEVIAKLSNFKTDIYEKIKLFKQFDKEISPGKDQWLIDLLCINLEQLSSNDSRMKDHTDGINQLIDILHNMIKSMSMVPSHNLFLKGNIYEILIKILKHDCACKDKIFLLCNQILGVKTWEKIIITKPNVLGEFLQQLCTYVKTLNHKKYESKDSEILKLMLHLLKLFGKQIRAQYNTRKVFQTFCQKQLLSMLSTRSQFESLDGKEKIEEDLQVLLIENIDEILRIVLCRKEHIASLKKLLTLEEPVEPIPKKAKKPVVFQQFFDVLLTEVSKEAIVGSGSVLYKNIVLNSRSINDETSLTRNEEFQLMICLWDAFGISADNNVKRSITLNACVQFFEVILEFDIYQASRDTDNKNFHWISHIVGRLLLFYDKYNTKEQEKIIKLFGIILKVNHLVIEAHLPEILGVCLYRDVDNSAATDLTGGQVTLLCGLLQTYSQLHKLGFMMQNLVQNINTDVKLPRRFIENYSKVISTLQISEILTYLKLYEEMSSELIEDLCSKNLVILQQVSHLLHYLVLVNASLIPENFYMKSDLQEIIQLIVRVKTKIESVQFGKLQNHSDTKFISIVYLLQHGMNQVALLLEEFSLLDEIPETSFVDLFTHFKASFKEDFSDSAVLYLETCLCFDEIKHSFLLQKTARFDEVTEVDNKNFVAYKKYLLQCLSQLVKNIGNENITMDVEQKTSDSMILNMTNENVWTELCKVFLQNMELLFSFDDPEINGAIAEMGWMVNMSLDVRNSRLEDLFTIFAYNNPSFQSKLLESIERSLKDIFTEVDSLTVLKEESDLAELKKLFSKVKQEEMTKLNRIFEGIEQINTEYLSKEVFTSLFTIIVNCLAAFKSNKLFEIADCLRLIKKLLGYVTVVSYRKFQLPFECLLKHLLDHGQLYFKVESNLIYDMTVFSSFTQAVLCTSKQEDELIKTTIVNQIKSLLTKKKSQPFGFCVLNKILDGAKLSFLQNHIITKGFSNALLTFLGSLLSMLCHVIFGEDVKTMANGEQSLSIFADVCEIVEKTFRGKKLTIKLDSIEESMSNCFQYIAPLIRDNLSSKNLSKEIAKSKQFLKIISFISSHNELAVALKKSITIDELDVLSSILSSLKGQPEEKGEFVAIVSKMVSDLDEEKLSKFLDILNQHLDNVFKEGNSFHVFEVWKSLLQSKWNKEKRVILWNSFPKLITVCCHVICTKQKFEESLTLLRILSSCMTLTRHSFVSSYFCMVYQIYNSSLVSFMQYDGNKRLTEVFEELYKVLSLFLFHHPNAVLPSIHSFINCTNSLFNDLVNLTLKQKDAAAITEEDKEKAFNRMSRLYFELGSHKESISKYTPYVISGYVRVFSSSYIPTKYKNILDTGIYEVFKACTDYELAMMSTGFELAEKEHFRILRSNFEKYHKYQGKT